MVLYAPPEEPSVEMKQEEEENRCKEGYDCKKDYFSHHLFSFKVSEDGAIRSRFFVHVVDKFWWNPRNLDFVAWEERNTKDYHIKTKIVRSKAVKTWKIDDFIESGEALWGRRFGWRSIKSLRKLSLKPWLTAKWRWETKTGSRYWRKLWHKSVEHALGCWLGLVNFLIGSSVNISLKIILPPFRKDLVLKEKNCFKNYIFYIFDLLINEKLRTSKI